MTTTSTASDVYETFLLFRVISRVVWRYQQFGRFEYKTVAIFILHTSYITSAPLTKVTVYRTHGDTIIQRFFFYLSSTWFQQLDHDVVALRRRMCWERRSLHMPRAARWARNIGFRICMRGICTGDTRKMTWFHAHHVNWCQPTSFQQTNLIFFSPLRPMAKHRRVKAHTTHTYTMQKSSKPYTEYSRENTQKNSKIYYHNGLRIFPRLKISWYFMFWCLFINGFGSAGSPHTKHYSHAAASLCQRLGVGEKSMVCAG